MQSAHAARRLTGRTDWAAIVELYDALLALTGSPVVAINRAVAHRRDCDGAAPPASRRSTPLDRRSRGWPSTSPTGPRAPSCWRGPARAQAAAEAYERAIGLEPDPAVRRFLQAALESNAAERS